ncbi:glycosyltransferase family 2 protein [Singulisphaera sp. PoT]|uniref:glycosyltransferase family 2 protein n=1 Tax=Singulisphaera sp. PoT TaxID=3411797 RepID=UPI003BF51D75
MKPTVDVSVVCANYNNSKYLPAFFESFETSTVWPQELLFVDDGSKDDSLAVAERYTGRLPFLKIIPLGKNQGFGNALNAGIEVASSPYLMRIDPDDVMQPNRIEVQHKILASGACDIVGSNAELFHSDTGATLGLTNFPLTESKISTTIAAGEHGVLHPTVMGRTEFFKEHRYIQAHVPAEDYDVFARMFLAGARFQNVPDVLMRYRVHEQSVSNALPFSTIQKTYVIRDTLFNRKTPKLWVATYYVHMKYYRRYLFAIQPVKKNLYLLISSAFYPSKVLRRVQRSLLSKSPAGAGQNA